MAYLYVDAPEMSLLGLEDELSCSICLSPFNCPVTIPCGHNFCHDCLLSSWKDSYSCPQCRTVFATQPELKKNTVLSTVVEAFNTRSGRSEAVTPEAEVKPEEEVETIRCDTCMEAEASQTCLTCMASYCEEHLRPHRDNPVFRLHQLSRPVVDLLERICPDHHKLMELFCSEHHKSICSLCLQQEHKGCSLTSQEEQRSLKESDLREKLSSLSDKIQKTNTVMNQLNSTRSQLKEAANDKKKGLAAVYQQIQDMLAQDEREAQREVDRELEAGEKKLQDTMTTLSKNTEKMAKGRETVNRLLAQSQDMAFLQASFQLPKVAKFEPHVPRVTLDSVKLKATQAFLSDLKENLTEILKQPVEARSTLLKSGEKAASSSGATNTESTGSKPQSGEKATKSSGAPKTESTGSKPQSETAKTARKNRTRSKSPGRPLIQPFRQLHPHLHPHPHPHLYPHPHPHVLLPPPHSAYMRPYFKGQHPGGRPHPPAGVPKAQQEYGAERKAFQPDLVPKPAQRTKDKISPVTPSDLSSSEKRSELLKHGVTLTFDPNTAHKRVALSNAFTQASMSDAQANSPDCPQRFDVCTQVLATESFSKGRHYWEVLLSSLSFVGIGLAYGSVGRKGPASRLGRNAQSWCVEWFNDRTSAWHDGSETVIASVTPKRVGVLLDCEEGTATLFRVADRAYPFHTFVFPFTEPVYPAFWIFSSDSTISICKVPESF